ncbi:hypothetical protein CCAND93_240011 [Capnocytophaga canis]|uniref:Uncharacterized protein n=1 Tax=Capnocytophaga canis TaxID=1848903 RepID=A0A0B7IKI9_9FLAO|nr:hypothetical protein CCAND93_240011 [Capnocytophaga canis]
MIYIRTKVQIFCIDNSFFEKKYFVSKENNLIFSEKMLSNDKKRFFKTQHINKKNCPKTVF